MNIEYQGRAAIVGPAQARPRQSGEHGEYWTSRRRMTALVRRQAVPERIETDGLVVDVPAGVYHPLPDSSSEFFIRNIKAMNPDRISEDARDRRGLRNHLALYRGQLDVEDRRHRHFADRRSGDARQRASSTSSTLTRVPVGPVREDRGSGTSTSSSSIRR